MIVKAAVKCAELIRVRLGDRMGRSESGNACQDGHRVP